MGGKHPTRTLLLRPARARLVLGIATVALAILAISGTTSAVAAPYAFEPINYKHIPLPESVAKELAVAPVFTPDGKHMLFTTLKDHLYVTNLSGTKINRIDCTGANGGPHFVDPFPDGKRIWLFPLGVYECKPSVVNCKTHTYVPVDTSAAVPPGGLVAPGGAANSYQIDVGGAAASKLAPDGEHIAFSDVRSDAFEEMVIAKLEKRKLKHDHQSPGAEPARSVLGARSRRWDPGQTPVRSTSSRPLPTEALTRPTCRSVAKPTRTPMFGKSTLPPVNANASPQNADWDEDMALSPDGSQLTMWSNRTTHDFDMQGGLLPVRDFIDMPMVAALANYYVNSDKKRSCAGPMWMLPPTGDEGAKLSGQPVVDYSQPKIKVANSGVPGWPIWSPDSTKLALSLADEETETDAAPYIEYAEFSAREPTAPEPVVSSEVGSWAPTPENWHGAFGYNGEKTLNGAGGGTVKLIYNGNPGAFFGTWSETYENYSEDGKSFVNGTTTIEVLEAAGAKVHESSHVKMTGENTGYTNIDMTLTHNAESGEGPASVEGSAETNYDGSTVKGPPQEVTDSTPCPNKRVQRPQLKATAMSLGGDEWEVRVTASVSGVGAYKVYTDTEPVNHAMIKGAGKATYTDNEGVAHVTAPHGKHKRTVLTVIAGEDLTPTALFLE